MLAVLKRELQSYFYSPIGYVFVGVFVLAAGIMFALNNVLSLSSDLNSTFDSLLIVYMILIPILTMKLMSDDRKTKADQLLLTSPLSVWSMVLGKFLAACSVFLIALACTGVYIVIVGLLGTLAVGEVITSYLGFMLLTSAYIAIGLLMSSVTENQISAAGLTFITIFGFWLLGFIAPNVDISFLPFLTSMMEWLSLPQWLYTFTSGILSLSAILFLLSFTAVLLFLAVRVIERRRWSEG